MELSVIIPFYNSQSHLREVIESIMNQTHKEFEVLLIDDGSTDSSETIARDTFKGDKRFRVLSSKNQGVSAARNRGLGLAKGDWLVFVDSDDYVEPDLLASIAAKAKFGAPEIIWFGHYEFVESPKSQLRKPPPCPPVDSPGRKFRTQDLAFKPHSEGSAAVWNKAFSRDFLSRHSLRFDKSLQRGTEDLDFSLRSLMLAREVSIIETSLYGYRREVAGSLSQDVLEMSLESVGVVARILKRPALGQKWKVSLACLLGRFILRALRSRPRLRTLRRVGEILRSDSKLP